MLSWVLLGFSPFWLLTRTYFFIVLSSMCRKWLWFQSVCLASVLMPVYLPLFLLQVTLRWAKIFGLCILLNQESGGTSNYVLYSVWSVKESFETTVKLSPCDLEVVESVTDACVRVDCLHLYLLLMEALPWTLYEHKILCASGCSYVNFHQNLMGFASCSGSSLLSFCNDFFIHMLSCTELQFCFQSPANSD